MILYMRGSLTHALAPADHDRTVITHCCLHLFLLADTHVHMHGYILMGVSLGEFFGMEIKSYHTYSYFFHFILRHVHT